MIKAVINISRIIGKTLNSRDEAQKLFLFLSSNYKCPESIVFDFDQVDFMSRSFADEFHKLKMNWSLEHGNIIIKIENASVQITDILQAVARTQKGRQINNSGRTLLSFTNDEQLSEYLLSM